MDSLDFLLVEDDPNDAELFELSLERNLPNGYKHHHLRDGEEAIVYFNKLRSGNLSYPNLVVLDLKLPKKSGLDVLKELKKKKETRHIPVVIFSCLGGEKEVDSCYRIGGNAYVEKPTDFNEFKKTVQSMINFWVGQNKSPKN